MFILSRLADNVLISPSAYSKPRISAVTDELNKKYANKILHNVGLCIRVLDILEISDGVVHPLKDGCYQSRVRFRLIVFKPFKGEVLLGKIASASPTAGVQVSMTFFDDILIPPVYLRSPSIFDKDRSIWIWQFNDENFELNLNSPIRFMIESLNFADVGPVRNTTLDAAKAKNSSNNASNEGNMSSLSIYGSADGEGLGIVDWWAALDDVEMDDDPDNEAA
ncbi:hypothetical protein SeLEV6574_g04174 [Synchytrium endobioticum]|nr:hypothetical protein SeLEV6574_g04174 [Synchytrium endobioticum]